MQEVIGYYKGHLLTRNNGAFCTIINLDTFKETQIGLSKERRCKYRIYLNEWVDLDEFNYAKVEDVFKGFINGAID